MSQKICRETYANYGSYLRSRGTDNAVCDLRNKIETGEVVAGNANTAGGLLNVSTSEGGATIFQNHPDNQVPGTMLLETHTVHHKLWIYTGGTHGWKHTNLT